ncbi:MAG TPA: hypothetical protein VIU46_04925 [Gallionellaceae bacterium]
MRAANPAARLSPCPSCRHRAWREIAGFLVMGCGKRGLRFGIAPDIRRNHVNKAGGCVAMPRECEM